MDTSKSLELTTASNFCIIPWVHLYYFTDGYVYPCPTLGGNEEMRIGKVSDSPESLWNSDVLKKMRSSMLKNKPIAQCVENCISCISSCKKSFDLDLLKYAKDVILNTSEDGTCDYNFIAWNLIESNICNLKCEYCSSNYSNLWNNKQVRRGLSYENLIEMYNQNYDNVKEIWFASGEPVLQDSTYYFLEKLLKDKKTNVRIRFYSNLTKTEYKGKKVYDLLSMFEDVIVFGSWDLDGERGEYIRKNSCSATIKRNIKEIQSKSNIRFILHSLMSAFNLYYYPDFHKRWFEEGLLKKDNIVYYTLNCPSKHRYSILPNRIKQKIETQLIDYKSWLGPNLDPFPNRECPLSIIDKMIETMYTGKWGHLGFSEKENNKLYNQFIKENFFDTNNTKFLKLFKELM